MDPEAVVKVIVFKVEGTKKAYCNARLAAPEEYKHDATVTKNVSLGAEGKFLVFVPQKLLPNNETIIVNIGPQVTLSFVIHLE